MQDHPLASMGVFGWLRNASSAEVFSLLGRCVPWFGYAAAVLCVLGLALIFLIDPVSQLQGRANSAILAMLLSAGCLSVFIFLWMAFWMCLGRMMNVRIAAFGHLRKLWVSYLALALTGIVVLLGVAVMIEMVYHLQLNAALGPEMRFMGMSLNAKGVNSWFGAVFVMLTGLGLFELCRRQFALEWAQIQESIEKEIKRREAL